MSSPWDTNDGQKWLAKALNPAGFQNVDLKGLPDQESHNVVVLNYQSQYEVEPPAMYNAVGTDYSTYEAEIVSYQDPIVFGVSAAYPSGTIDPLSNNKTITLNFGSAAQGHEAVPAIVCNSTGGIMFPRTCKVFINSQLGLRNDMESAYDTLKGTAQRHRVIYGAVQAIPTCSSQDNSGTICVSQQQFIGDNFNNRVSHATGYGMKDWYADDNAHMADLLQIGRDNTATRIYTDNDFPNSEDAIRNPAALITRFYEGCYAPYKLKNPFQEDFITSSDNTCSAAPFWTVGAAYRAKGSGVWTVMDWDVASHSFVAPKGPNGTRPNVLCEGLRLSLMSKTGSLKTITFANWDAAFIAGTNAGDYTAIVNLTEDILNNFESDEYAAYLADNNSDSVKTWQFMYNGTPQVKGGAGADANDPVFNMNIWRCGDAGIPRPRLPNSNMCSIIAKAMNMKGNITLMYRVGVEIVVTGASTYSPFNHRSPQYDEAALKSYLKISHRMSDGFYGNAATDTFHTGLYQWIINNLYTPDDTVDFANRGSYWRGVISAA